MFNSIATVPLIWILNRIASDHQVMGAATSGWLSRVILMITFIGIAGAVVALVLVLASRLTS